MMEGPNTKLIHDHSIVMTIFRGRTIKLKNGGMLKELIWMDIYSKDQNKKRYSFNQ